ncbi:MAG: DegT/DnrJ/EryC1/StrS family aminotransferase [Acidobacteriaceae bacterium]|nr:DegT/DnrJ/EryC1/StrS family aminotransferase [Acidobacteriaceae bacterium]
MSSPDITDCERAAVAAVLNTPTLSIGPQVVAFEHAVARTLGVRHAVAVSSGTAGLHCALIGAGVDAGALVLTSPFSFVASANVMLYERAVPVFVDVDPATGNMRPDLTCEAIEDLAHGGARAARWLPPSVRGTTTGPLKAVLPVHAFGQPADLAPILSACASRGLTVIEDACEAIGATYNGRQAGTLGASGVFAFYPNKQMTSGEGGLLITDDGELAALARSLRNQGRDDTGGWLHHVRLGFNYRMDEMSAALALVQFDRLEELLQKRARVAEWYTERLRDVAALELPYTAATTTRMSWFVYVVRTRRAADRDRVVAHLRRDGIPSRPYFSPIHLQPFYQAQFGYAEGTFAACEDWGARAIAVPFSSVMTVEQVEIVCRSLRRALEH